MCIYEVNIIQSPKVGKANIQQNIHNSAKIELFIEEANILIQRCKVEHFSNDHVQARERERERKPELSKSTNL